MEPCRRPPLVLALALTLATAAADAAPLPRIAVHPGGHYLQTEDGRPFFWLGDTAWQLVNSTTREECSYYLHTRARQAFTVIQTVALPENDSLRRAGPLAVLPFEGADPARPTPAYFDRVVEIVDHAAAGAYLPADHHWQP